MKVYLDNCALGRPEDEQVGMVKKQADAVLAILEGVRQGRWELLHSDIHEEELAQVAPVDRARHLRMRRFLSLATGQVLDAAEALPLYEMLRAAPRGRAPLLKPYDGYHLAVAAWYGAQAFVTVDRKLYLWCRAHHTLLRGMVVLRPGEFLVRFNDAQGTEEEA